MKTIRQNVFETNSSSSHSVTIRGDARNKSLKSIRKALEYGKLTIQRGEFGWEEEEYSDFESKLSYAYTLAAGDGCFWSGNPKVKDYIDSDHNDHLKMLYSVIRDNIGEVDIIFENNEGYIDHQSRDLIVDIFESSEILADFLFSPYSILKTDNDNH